MSDYRWHAKAYYLAENGIVDVEHYFDELEQLQSIIENGPSWQALERIEIFYRGLREKLTVEEAKKL